MSILCVYLEILHDMTYQIWVHTDPGK